MSFAPECCAPSSGCRPDTECSPHVGGSLRCSLGHGAQHSGHADQIAGDHGQLEVLINAFDSPIDGLSNPADSFAPAEMFLNALTDDLTDLITVRPSMALLPQRALLRAT